MERNGYLSYTGADTPSVDALDDPVGTTYAIALFLEHNMSDQDGMRLIITNIRAIDEACNKGVCTMCAYFNCFNEDVSRLRGS